MGIDIPRCIGNKQLLRRFSQIFFLLFRCSDYVSLQSENTLNLLKRLHPSRGNPYTTSDSSKLYHFTKANLYHQNCSEQLIGFFDDALNWCMHFKKNRYRTKVKTLSGFIKHVNLSAFGCKSKKPAHILSHEIAKKAWKELGKAQKSIDIYHVHVEFWWGKY